MNEPTACIWNHISNLTFHKRMSIQLPERLKCKTYGSFYQQHKILAFHTLIKNVNHKLTVVPKTCLRHLIFER